MLITAHSTKNHQAVNVTADQFDEAIAAAAAVEQVTARVAAEAVVTVPGYQVIVARATIEPIVAVAGHQLTLVPARTGLDPRSWRGERKERGAAPKESKKPERS